MHKSRRRFLVGSGIGLAALTTGAALVSRAGLAIGRSGNQLPADITKLSASALSAAIKARQVSCAEVMSAYLARIERYNPLYNAIVAMPDREELMRQAGEADAALARGEYHGWMHGMPHAVKDLSHVRGLVSSAGSPIFAGQVAQADDVFVQRLRAQGAIFIGKTNVPEFGLGSQSYNPVYGVTRNAYNPELCAGGSSGGAACAMAAHLVPCADGSDMMGSLRNPAAYNNVIGFRPSQGRVPSASRDLFMQQLGYEGPMGRNVEDTIRLLVTMAGYDARAPMSLRDEVASPRPIPAESVKQYRLGWMGDYDGYLATEPGVLQLCEKALNHLSERGAVVEPCQPNYDMARLWQTWLTLRHWTVSGAFQSLYNDPAKRVMLKPEAVWEVEGGLGLSGLDVSRASIARSDWYRALHALLSEYDFLVLPTAQVFPFAADLHWPVSIAGRKMDTYHRWMEVTIGGTLSGCPVVNVPAGFDSSGRPMGLQVIGPMGEDSRLLEFAMAYEAGSDYLDRRPSLREQL